MFSGLSSILTTKVEIEKIAREPGELRTLVKELVVHAARADQVKTKLKETIKQTVHFIFQRAWGRIIDTEADVLDPSRAPKVFL